MMCSTNNYKLMLGFLLSTIIVIVSVSAQNQDPYDQLSVHWFNKCSEQTKSNAAFDKLYAHAVEFKRFLKYAFQFIPNEKKTFCDSERKTLMKLMKELSDDMKPCLADKEKYMSDFVYTSFTEFLHFLCHNNEEHLNIFFSPNAAECRTKLFNNTDSGLNPCLSRLLKPTSGSPTKKEMCTDLTTVKTCFTEVLSSQCPSYGAYKKLNEEFFKYISKPCSACASYLNTLLLALSVLVSYLFSR